LDESETSNLLADLADFDGENNSEDDENSQKMNNNKKTKEDSDYSQEE
jgi:hypothetical protein